MAYQKKSASNIVKEKKLYPKTQVKSPNISANVIANAWAESANDRVGLRNLSHLPIVRDNLIQLPQALSFNAHNYFEQSSGDDAFR